MSNHIHFVVRAGNEPLERLMTRIEYMGSVSRQRPSLDEVTGVVCAEVGELWDFEHRPKSQLTALARKRIVTPGVAEYGGKQADVARKLNASSASVAGWYGKAVQSLPDLVDTNGPFANRQNLKEPDMLHRHHRLYIFNQLFLLAAIVIAGCGSPKSQSTKADTAPARESSPKPSSAATIDTQTASGSKGAVSLKTAVSSDSESEMDTTAPSKASAAPVAPSAPDCMKGIAQTDVTAAIISEWLPPKTPIVIMETAEHGPFTYVLFRLNGVTVFEHALQKIQGTAAFDTYRAKMKKTIENRSERFEDIESFLASYKGVSHFRNLQMSLISGDSPWSVGFAKLKRSPLPAINTNEIDTNAVNTNAGDTDAGQVKPLQQWTRLYGVFLLDGIRMRTYTESVEAAKQELRIRDMDGDRRPEAKIVFKGVAETNYQPMIEQEESSGYTAFILDCSDGHVQAAFARELNTTISMQGTNGNRSSSEMWRFNDINEDGHPDLNVVRRWRSEMTYYECEEDSPGPETVKDSGKDEWQCLYRAEDDKWHCPPSPSDE